MEKKKKESFVCKVYQKYPAAELTRVSFVHSGFKLTQVLVKQCPLARQV